MIYRVLIFTYLLTILACSNTNAQNRLVINGNIDQSMNGNVISLKRISPYPTNLSDSTINVSSIIRGGKFMFSIAANELELYVLEIEVNNEKVFQSFQLLPQSTVINFLDTKLKTYEVFGNKINSDYLALEDKLDASQNVEQDIASWIADHPDSPLNAQLLFDLSKIIPETKTSALYKIIPENNKNNSWGRELKFIIEHLFTGTMAPNFSQRDTAGKKIELSQFQGKYVLIDFWASWCVPCRKENPELRKAYELYHNKGLEIISVSLDDKRSNWVDAINADKLNWNHVSDLKGWNNEISKNYRIGSVPSNFLIDPSGKIVAKNLRGEQVLKILANFIIL